MKFQLPFFLVLVIGTSILSACHIEKRVHRPGYHVQFNKSKSAKSSRIEKQNIAPHIEEIQVQKNEEKEELLASSNEVNKLSDFNTGNALTNSISKELANIFIENCDTIVFVNGYKKIGKIVEISPELIKYKRCNSADGSLTSVKTYYVHKIIYSNGLEDIITDEVIMELDEELASTLQSDGSKLEMFGLFSLISAIVGLLILGIVFEPLAIVLGIIGLVKHTSEKQKFVGSGLAIAGIIIGLLGLLLLLAFFVL